MRRLNSYLQGLLQGGEYTDECPKTLITYLGFGMF